MVTQAENLNGSSEERQNKVPRKRHRLAWNLLNASQRNPRSFILIHEPDAGAFDQERETLWHRNGAVNLAGTRRVSSRVISERGAAMLVPPC